MADFRDVAAKAKAAHEARQAEEQNRYEQQKKEREAFVAAAVSVLKSDVIPILERAKDGFAESGVDSVIETRFDVENFVSSVLPSVKFQCVGPKRADGWRFEAVPVFFSSDGELVITGIGEHSFDREAKKQLAKVHRSESEAAISAAVEKAVESYYAELEAKPHLK